MADKSDDFELVPLRQIQELREELARLKESPMPSPKRLEVSLDEVAGKLDKLIAIFEDASHRMRMEEGGMTISAQFGMLAKKLQDVVEQNEEIAKGIVAVADMVNEMKSAKPAPLGTPSSAPPGLFPPGGALPPPPLPPKKRGLFK